MEHGVTLIYDGSFNGFLCAVYKAYESKLFVTGILKEDQYQEDMFSNAIVTKTELNKAKRVWYKLQDKHYEALKNIYFAFLSETPGIEIRLYRQIVRRLGRLPITSDDDVQNGFNYLEGIVSRVSREKRKWEASINLNFAQGKPAIVRIRPKYNILPLISRFFRLTHHSNPWIIFDQQRNYGIYFDGDVTQMVTEIPRQFNWVDAA
ncbi:DUF4130 domain-containing protein [Lentiprolixibacter aurantiacus]|uniref:DUF4130 domain-containing protein n=1 Tax=Lentiprolixibacter aurantiacus TaxID=2993939 RepID=A0AAE3MMN0_9FLAO|nr:DUF4130 domain-containing protein [Lentiprolixibacter aurantiacus]MCX2719679.1 DUF4130 domain-containing protein [Lentiprolixibacter aurantiacus]